MLKDESAAAACCGLGLDAKHILCLSCIRRILRMKMDLAIGARASPCSTRIPQLLCQPPHQVCIVMHHHFVVDGIYALLAVLADESNHC